MKLRVIGHFRVICGGRERFRVTFHKPCLRQRVGIGDRLCGGVPLLQRVEVQQAVGHEAAHSVIVGVGIHIGLEIRNRLYHPSAVVAQRRGTVAFAFNTLTTLS